MIANAVRSLPCPVYNTGYLVPKIPNKNSRQHLLDEHAFGYASAREATRPSVVCLTRANHIEGMRNEGYLESRHKEGRYIAVISLQELSP